MKSRLIISVSLLMLFSASNHCHARPFIQKHINNANNATTSSPSVEFPFCGKHLSGKQEVAMYDASLNKACKYALEAKPFFDNAIGLTNLASKIQKDGLHIPGGPNFNASSPMAQTQAAIAETEADNANKRGLQSAHKCQQILLIAMAQWKILENVPETKVLYHTGRYLGLAPYIPASWSDKGLQYLRILIPNSESVKD